TGAGELDTSYGACSPSKTLSVEQKISRHLMSPHRSTRFCVNVTFTVRASSWFASERSMSAMAAQWITASGLILLNAARSSFGFKGSIWCHFESGAAEGLLARDIA